MPNTFADPRLPIVDEIGEALYAAATAVAQPGRRRWPSALRRRPGRSGVVVAILVLGLSGSAGGLALAGTFNGTAENPQAWVDGQRVQPEAAMTPDQTADLGILRRPRVASDALPSDEIQLFTESPAAANGPNIALSRSAQGLGGGASAWLVPGNGMICFAYDNPGAGGGGTCQPDTLVNDGRMLLFGGYTSAHPVESVAGVVPDGVASVTLNATSGDTITVAVHENVYIATLPGIVASMTFQGADGLVTVGSE